jgi:hypothetical protein
VLGVGDECWDECRERRWFLVFSWGCKISLVFFLTSAYFSMARVPTCARSSATSGFCPLLDVLAISCSSRAATSRFSAIFSVTVSWYLALIAFSCGREGGGKGCMHVRE